MINETTVCKKEVCPKKVIYGQTKEKENILVKSKMGNVTYIVTNITRDIFTKERYKSIFNLLDKIEVKLNAPLNFYVPLDYITVGAFTDYFNNEELEKIFQIIDTKIFELITDISYSKNMYNSKSIANKYLYNSKLSQLKEYYDSNNEFIQECFRQKYSSLPLFDMLHQKENTSSSLLNNIYECIKSNNNNSLRNIASGIIVELRNEEYTLQSESAIEELYHYVYQINKNFKKLTNDDAKIIENSNIESIFLFIQEYTLKNI